MHYLIFDGALLFSGFSPDRCKNGRDKNDPDTNAGGDV